LTAEYGVRGRPLEDVLIHSPNTFTDGTCIDMGIHVLEKRKWMMDLRKTVSLVAVRFELKLVV
jgi:hypothetical protein